MRVLTWEKRWRVTPPESPPIQEGRADVKIGREKGGGHCLGHIKLPERSHHVVRVPSLLHTDTEVREVLSLITTSIQCS